MTKLSVSTHWIAHRHTDGNAMVDELNQAGFSTVELGYDTMPDLVPGIRNAISEKRIRCRSVHNFCPVPDSFSKGHPELFSLSSLDPGDRQSAVYNSLKSIRFAAQIGAEVVVTHAGNVAMRPFTGKLAKLYHRGKHETPRYDRLRAKAMYARHTPANIHMNALYVSIEELLPELETLKIKLAFENLPSLEALPAATEHDAIFDKFPSSYICYWHDFGHAQVMQNLRLEPHFAKLHRFSSRTAGLHIHDTDGTEDAHRMPPIPGGIHWDIARKLINPDWCMVLEPAPGTDAADVKRSVQYLEKQWGVQ